MAVQAMIEAREAYDALVYGLRAFEEMGNRDYGCTEEWGAPDWAVRQFEAAKAAAATFGLELDGQATAWNLKRAKKLALEALRAAEAEKRAIGTARQIRLALAA